MSEQQLTTPRPPAVLFGLLALRLHQIEQAERRCYNELENAQFRFPESYVSTRVRRLLELYNIARQREANAGHAAVLTHDTLQKVVTRGRALVAEALAESNLEKQRAMLEDARKVQAMAQTLASLLEELHA